MAMLLMALCLSLFGLAMACVAFAAAIQQDNTEPEARPERRPTLAVQLEPPRFFADTGEPVPAQGRVPVDVLLKQLEEHIKAEQAAAESFIHYPTAASLHSRTTSPLAH